MKPTLFTALALALVACGGSPSDVPVPVLDLSAAIDNPQKFDLTEIAQEIAFIPLDDSQPEALLSGVSRLQETPNRFYVRDNMERPVKVFDRSGRFVGTRGMIGRGPGEFTNISQILTDPASDNLYIVGRASDAGAMDRQAMIGFDADGKEFARNNSVPQGQILFSGGQIVAQTGVPSIDAAADGSDKPWTLIETYSLALERTGQLDVPDTGTPRTMSPIAMFGPMYSSRALIHGNGSEVLVSHALNDTVHVFRSGTGRGERGEPHLEPAFVLDRGAKTPPASMYSLAPTELWNARYYRLGGLNDGGRWLFVTVDNMGMNPASGGNRAAPVVIDRGAGEGVPGGSGFAALRPDGEPGLTLDGISFSIQYVTGNRLVGAIQALDIVDNAEAITHPGLKSLATTLREDSNPVLVIATLKN